MEEIGSWQPWTTQRDELDHPGAMVLDWDGDADPRVVEREDRRTRSLTVRWRTRGRARWILQGELYDELRKQKKPTRWCYVV